MSSLIKILLLFSISFLFTGCDTVTDNGAISYYMFSFSNFETILLLVGLSIASFIFTGILAPVAISFLVFTYMKKLFSFIFAVFGNKGDAEQSDFFTGKIITHVIFIIIGLTIVLIKVPVGIKVVTATEVSTSQVPLGTRKWSDAVGNYKLNDGVVLDLGATSNSVFGPGHWFSTGDKTYKELLGEHNIAANNTSGTIKFYLPLGLVLPLNIADGLLYGDKGSNGILAALFKDTYPMLVNNPGHLFEIMSANSPYLNEAEDSSLLSGYTSLIEKEGMATAQMNEDFAFVVANYNLIPLTIYNAIERDRQEQKNASGNNEAVTEYLKKIDEAGVKYNNKLRDLLKTELKSQSFNISNGEMRATIKENEKYYNISKTPPEISTLNKSDIDLKTFSDNKIVYTDSPVKNQIALNRMGITISLADTKDSYGRIYTPKTAGGNDYIAEPKYSLESQVEQKLSFNLYSYYDPQITKTNNVYNLLVKQNEDILTDIKDKVKVNGKNVTQLQTPPYLTNQERKVYAQKLILEYKDKYSPNVGDSPIEGKKFNEVSIFSPITIFNEVNVKDNSLLDKLDKLVVDYEKELSKINLGEENIDEETKMQILLKYDKPNKDAINSRIITMGNNGSAAQKDIKEEFSNLLAAKLNNEWLNTSKIASDSLKSTEKKPDPAVSLTQHMKNGGGWIVDIISTIVATLIGFVFKIVIWLLNLVLPMIYGFVYAMHSIGIIVILFLFPLKFFTQVIVAEKWESLFEPFKEFLSYRMWDFALLLATEVMLITGPIILKVAESMNPIISLFVQLLYLFAIFWITGTLVKMITELFGGKNNFNLFNAVANQAGATTQMTAGLGIAGGGALAMGGARGANALTGGKLGAGAGNLANMVASGASKMKDGKLGQVAAGFSNDMNSMRNVGSFMSGGMSKENMAAWTGSDVGGSDMTASQKLSNAFNMKGGSVNSAANVAPSSATTPTGSTPTGETAASMESMSGTGGATSGGIGSEEKPKGKTLAEKVKGGAAKVIDTVYPASAPTQSEGKPVADSDSSSTSTSAATDTSSAPKSSYSRKGGVSNLDSSGKPVSGTESAASMESMSGTGGGTSGGMGGNTKSETPSTDKKESSAKGEKKEHESFASQAKGIGTGMVNDMAQTMTKDAEGITAPQINTGSTTNVNNNTNNSSNNNTFNSNSKNGMNVGGENINQKQLKQMKQKAESALAAKGQEATQEAIKSHMTKQIKELGTTMGKDFSLSEIKTQLNKIFLEKK